MARVYLEISFISALVSTRADAGSVYRRDTSQQWWSECRSLHEVYISAEVLRELSQPDYPCRISALEHASGLPLVEINEAVIEFAGLLVREKVMPAPIAGDAIHVAVACMARLEYVLSWNVRHLANPRKVVHLHRVCARAGLRAPMIVTPESLWDDPV